ncbi:hypothetical protein SEA_MICRODON_66 [Streptomyces phage Microdon]|nr:hypothetical protein SEA_MICRODON_66 [Streptomyces phage Microdon]
MAARTKKTDADATEPKAEKKTRQPKPVTDLPSATVALKAAQRRADRAGKALSDAETENDAAQTALAAAKKDVDRYYRELMGMDVEPEPVPEPTDYEVAHGIEQ